MLFVEDIHEPLYRVDRMLTQLYLSGSLNSIRAMILGASIASVLDDVAVARIRERVGDLTLAFGVASGHTTPNFTLPLGCRVRIDAERSLLVFEDTQRT